MTYTPRIIQDFTTLSEQDWARLDHAGNPFVSHTFLAALEQSGSLGPHNGWSPHHLALFDGDDLFAFAPAYLKTNSHGEFVFDWAWADAYQRHGLAYYPKLLTAVPYSPVTGPRLLARADHPDAGKLKTLLFEYAIDLCREQGWSSWHCNFFPEDDEPILHSPGLLSRFDWQFHWHNRGYSSFDEFLAGLRSRKRKNIRRERRQVAAAGIEFEWKTGGQVDPDDLDLIYHCYASTFHQYGNHPALRPAFFAALATGLGDGFRVCIARLEDEPVAMSLFLAGGGRLYGRYWGCLEEIPGLHFEAAYYQGIELCIRENLDVFESGAQGEHKIARGFSPVRTRSCHFIAEPAFRKAIGEFLQREKRWLGEYRDELLRHLPYRKDTP